MRHPQKTAASEGKLCGCDQSQAFWSCTSSTNPARKFVGLGTRVRTCANKTKEARSIQEGGTLNQSDYPGSRRISPLSFAGLTQLHISHFVYDCDNGWPLCRGRKWHRSALAGSEYSSFHAMAELMFPGCTSVAQIWFENSRFMPES